MNTALTIFILTALAGFVCLVGGVFLLAGPGWSLIATAGSLFAIAGFLRKGMTIV